MPPLLEIRDLKTHFFTDSGVVKAVDGVSLTIPRGKTLGVVGESGCGKSVTAMSVMQLVSHPGRIVDGSITFYEKDQPIVLSSLSDAEMRQIRGAKIAMIFQEPMTSLNPVFTIGWQIIEAILLHRDVTYDEARRRTIELLAKVQIAEPERRVDEYPHQLSGGMRQRVMIAMALACDPELLIADEPTTALDVTVQAQILDLLRRLQSEQNMSIMIITHDLGIIAEMADEVAVMYASKVVEQAPVAELFKNPRHPYTAGLFASRPKPATLKSTRLTTIEGMVPPPTRFPPGCKFHPRCPYCQNDCTTNEPELRSLSPLHSSRCHYAEEIDFTIDPRVMSERLREKHQGRKTA
jgi:oligopeptide/dipeptide ABC transporter ATP-binding protein